MVAARTGRSDVINQLFEAGAMVDATESWRGQTALMWAATENNADAISQLLTAGADVEARSAGGLTRSFSPFAKGKSMGPKALIAGGADVNAGFNNDTTSTGSYEPPF
ncbi:MAG: hypothetical protein CM1200mP25_1890 [Acidobacteriota bacterium]|nr:MAG: hypothetical protein CM1200mP25_1890 [Acidobacteriota bacterium]